MQWYGAVHIRLPPVQSIYNISGHSMAEQLNTPTHTSGRLQHVGHRTQLRIRVCIVRMHNSIAFTVGHHWQSDGVSVVAWLQGRPVQCCGGPGPAGAIRMWCLKPQGTLKQWCWPTVASCGQYAIIYQLTEMSATPRLAETTACSPAPQVHCPRILISSRVLTSPIRPSPGDRDSQSHAAVPAARGGIIVT